MIQMDNGDLIYLGRFIGRDGWLVGMHSLVTATNMIATNLEVQVTRPGQRIFCAVGINRLT